MISSLGVHIGLFFVIVALLSYRPDPRAIEPKPSDPLKVVYLQQVGPGGGGGGSPAPAPPKPLEIPKHKAPTPVPVVMPPPPVETTPPPPTLDAPIVTNMASVMQATGNSSVSLASFGGGGRGVGLGPGRGDGVGPGWDGGFGGGAKRPGAGINLPTIIKQVEPKYTSEAMRAKVQGAVELEAVVMPNGTIGDVRVTKSLDKAFGLDLEAIKAAKGWLFRPGTDRDGKAVGVIVTLILEFRLH